MNAKSVSWGFFGYMGVMTITIVQGIILQWIGVSAPPPESSLPFSWGLWLHVGVVVPFIEEVVNRYLLFLLPVKRWGKSAKKQWFIAFMSSALFASLHGLTPLWMGYMVSGMIYCGLCLRGGLGASFFAHLLWNQTVLMMWAFR